MSTRSDNAGEAKPLFPFISEHQFTSTLATWPVLLTASPARAVCQETPQEHQTAQEMPRLQNSFMFSEMRTELMSFEEDAVHKSCRGHSPQPTCPNQPQSSTGSVPAESLCPEQWHKPTKLEWWSQVELPFGFLAIPPHPGINQKPTARPVKEQFFFLRTVIFMSIIYIFLIE